MSWTDLLSVFWGSLLLVMWLILRRRDEPILSLCTVMLAMGQFMVPMYWLAQTYSPWLFVAFAGIFVGTVFSEGRRVKFGRSPPVQQD